MNSDIFIMFLQNTTMELSIASEAEPRHLRRISLFRSEGWTSIVF